MLSRYQSFFSSRNRPLVVFLDYEMSDRFFDFTIIDEVQKSWHKYGMDSLDSDSGFCIILGLIFFSII